MSSPRWYRPVELLGLALVLLALGVVRFSQITPAQQREIELETGLEQLHYLEQAYFAQRGSYFDPTEPALDWRWMAECEWEVHLDAQSFWIAARADLDGDGEAGMWRIDAGEARVRRLVED